MKIEEENDKRVIAYLRTVSVRNLPRGVVSKERLKGIFERFGRVDTVVISSETTACVVYKKKAAAEEAINAINFSGEPLLIDGNKIHVFMWREVGLDPSATLFDTSDAECSISVSNISGTTTPQVLKSYFSVFGGIKYEPKIEGIGEVRRFAHITYRHSVHRVMALQADGENLDGSVLVVNLCYRRRQ